MQIGVHIRGGDFFNSVEVNYGLTVIDSQYLNNSFSYFTKHYDAVQFLITTDDWNSSNKLLSDISGDFNVVRVMNNSAGEDMAILSGCDAVIMSTGSFGYWAGWLANRTVVYYENWPRKGSPLAAQCNAADYFPRTWIALR
jgi:hypothetical protein